MNDVGCPFFKNVSFNRDDSLWKMIIPTMVNLYVDDKKIVKMYVETTKSRFLIGSSNNLFS